MYRFDGLDNLPINYSISDKSDGNTSFLWGEKDEVENNRQSFYTKAGVEADKSVMMALSHSTNVAVVDSSDSGKGVHDNRTGVNADGIITKEVGLTLSIIVADCAPVIFFDFNKRVLALVHINGMNPDIIDETLNKFTSKFNSDTQNIVVSFGPCILKESFVVPTPFQIELPEWKDYVKDVPDGRTSIDMLGFLINRVIELGVPEAQVFKTDIDTYKEEDLFSHRRSAVIGEPEGRFMVVANII